LLTKLGLSSRSSARYYSSVKGFFGYLFSSGYIEINPMEKVSAPKVSKGLPNVLNINEIEAILSQPDTSKKLGLRDKALLETFYACGLRVSELINLKISDLFLDEEMIRVFGKGSKERFVPIGSSAINWISEYLKNSRPLLEKKARSQHILFLNNRGTKLSRMGIWKIVSNYAKLAGIKRKFIRIHSDIHLQHTCLKAVPIFVLYKKCSDTLIFPPHRFTHTLTGII